MCGAWAAPSGIPIGPLFSQALVVLAQGGEGGGVGGGCEVRTCVPPDVSDIV